MGYYFTILSLLSLGLGYQPLALGATDGQPGASSQGRLQISLQVPPQVQLSGLQDIVIPAQASGQASAQTHFCVYSGSGQYQLAAYGSGTAGSFSLQLAGSDPGTPQRQYQLAMDDGTGAKPLSSGVVLTGLSGADPGSRLCDNTGPNGQLRILSPGEPGQGQRAGTYQGTLTLTVAPE